MNIIELPVPLEFEWDKGNEYKNSNKHGVPNAETEEVFSLVNIILFDEKHSSQERRYTLFGKTSQQKLLCIIFIIRRNKVRVISSRRANVRERNWYESEIKKNT